MFFIKLKDLSERTDFVEFLKSSGINPMFHYIPLHTSPAGSKLGKFSGIDVFTTNESERLVRLPLFYGLTKIEVERIIKQVNYFFNQA